MQNARLVGLAALAASVTAVPVAQGAMGTSTTLITTARPDLTSVTTPGSQGGPTADFCFSKGLGVASAGSECDFILNGYDGQKPLFADSIAQINNNCIEATYTDKRRERPGRLLHGTSAGGCGGGRRGRR